MTDEEIIAEAKQRYPVGTKFYPIHVSQGGCNKGEYLVVTDDSIFKMSSNTLYLFIGDMYYINDNKKNPSKYGNSILNRTLYENGKWAYIIETAKSKSLPIFN